MTGKTEKTEKVATKKVKKTSEKSDAVVKRVSISKKKIDGSKAAYVNAISLVLALVFGAIAICLGIGEFSGWEFFGSMFVVLFEFPAVAFGILSVICAVICIFSVNKITDKTAFEKIWKILYKVCFGFGLFKAIDVVSIVIYALLAISPNSGVDQGYLWLNQFLPAFIIFVVYMGVALLAKKILAGKTVLVRIFGIIAMIFTSVGCLVVLISSLCNLYNTEQIDDLRYSDDSLEIENQDIQNLFDSPFFNPFGF